METVLEAGDGGGVVAEGDTLHLSKVTERDAGTYIVRAENALGKARRAVTVLVLHPPRYRRGRGIRMMKVEHLP